MRRAALLLAVLVLPACGGSAGTPPDITGEWEFARGTAGGTDLPHPDAARATVEFDGQELRGVAFCNSYFSAYRLTGSSFSVDRVGTTEMGCAPDVMAAESAYLTALAAVDTVTTAGDGLLLAGEDVELRFTPVATVPDSPLESTGWVLETVVDGRTASSTVGEPAVLTLGPDRTLAATTGCRAITGPWLVEAGALVVDDLLPDGGPCPPDVAGQDAHVTAVLESGPAVTIEEDRLTLAAPDGRGLVYRAGA